MSLHLNYRGDRTAFDPDQVLGPDTAYAYYAPVSATYDPDADVTEIRLRPILPAEMSTRIDDAHTRMEQCAHIHDLFIGGGD